MIEDTFDRFQPRERGRFGDNERRDDRRDDRRGRAEVRATQGAAVLDVEVVLHYGTAKAVLVSLAGDNSKATWLSRDLIELDFEGARLVPGTNRAGRAVELSTVVVTLPRWLANSKGLI